MKKLLALVLALVMTLSLCTISNAAYSDAADVDYKEAVDVMTAAGVFNGTDGKFNPDGILTREQAAKIVTYMLLGKKAADSLVTIAAPFADVAADRWSAGSIAYCYNEGILAGVGEGKFAPTAQLTGLAFAKMMLTALGYDAELEGLTGSNWSINVAKKALTLKLTKGMDDVVLSAPMTREQAAKMAFNVLGVDTVYYKNTSTITAGNVTIKTNTVAETDHESFNDKYLSKLDKVASAYDEFNRPGHSWKYDKKVVGTYVDEPVASFTCAYTKAADIKTLLDGYTFAADANLDADNAKNILFVNGTRNTDALAGATLYDELAALSANGKLVEFYDTNDDDVIDRVVAVALTFGEVKSVKTTAATSTEGEYVTYTIKTSGANGKIYNTTVDSDEDDTLVLHGDVAKGDKVLYVNGAAKNILHIYALETVSGVLSKKTSDNKFTVDGTVYKLSSVTGASAPSVGTKSQDLYVDAYGYIVAAKTSTAADYAFVMKTATSYAQNSDGTLDEAYVATLVFPDGTIKQVYTVDSDGDAKDYASDTYLTKDANNSYYGVVSYKVNGDGKYELTKVATDTSRNVAVSSLDSKVEKIGTTIYANANTKFVYMDYKSSATTKLAGTVTVVDGLSKVATVADGANAFAVDTDSTVDGVADVVYVYANVSTTATSKYIYVTGKYDQTGSSTFEYIAYKNGEATTLKLAAADATHMTEGLYSTMTISNKAWSADEDAVALASIQGVKVVGGLLYLSTDKETYTVTEVTLKTSNTNHQAMLGAGIAEVGSSVHMYEIDTGDDTCELVEDMSVAVEGAVYVELNSANDAIANIYVVHA